MNSGRILIYSGIFLGLIGLIMSGCTKSNTTTDPVVPTGTVTDLDGNSYKTVVIGTQTWMAENLKSLKLNDGTAIPRVTNNNSWSNLTTMAYSYYTNDTTIINLKYGLLYNWYTVDTKKLCPTGWHVPTADEWTTLNTFLGVDSLAGGKLKEASLSFWSSPNLHATNSTGFTALPCGYRFYNGSFNNFGYSGNWWSSSQYSSTLVWYRFLTYKDGFLGKNYYDKTYGFSVRCIKD